MDTTRPHESGSLRPADREDKPIQGSLRPAEGSEGIGSRSQIQDSQWVLAPWRQGLVSIDPNLGFSRFFTSTEAEPLALPRFRSDTGRAVPPGLSRGRTRRERGRSPRSSSDNYPNRTDNPEASRSSRSHSAHWSGLRYNPCNRSVVARRAGIGGHRPAAGIRSSRKDQWRGDDDESRPGRPGRLAWSGTPMRRLLMSWIVWSALSIGMGPACLADSTTG